MEIYMRMWPMHSDFTPVRVNFYFSFIGSGTSVSLLLEDLFFKIFWSSYIAELQFCLSSGVKGNRKEVILPVPVPVPVLVLSSG